MGAISAPIFYIMRTKRLTQAALMAALYLTLTQFQNMLLPGSATWAVQLRVAECMCILAFFTPSAVWGLTVGCLLFNLAFVGAMPLDILLGALATIFSTGGMYLTRKVTLLNIPLFGLCLPAVFNGLLVGWELTLYVGGGFWLNALYVALGELAVMLTLGTLLYTVICRRKLQKHIV